MRPQIQRFADEYLVDLNAAQAAIRAGYSARRARQMGFDLLQRADVQAYVAERRAVLARRVEVTQERVIAEIARIGFASLSDYMRVTPDGAAVVDLAGMDRDSAAALSEITVDEYMDGRGGDARPVKRVRVKLADKLAALTALGKHLGMFVDRSDVRLTLDTSPTDKLAQDLAEIEAELGRNGCG